MADIDKIDGPGIHTIIEALQSDQTLVKLRIPAKDFNHLTIITDLRLSDQEAYFQIDYPHGFKEAVQGLDEWRLKFEFTGPDKLPYAFSTLGGERTGKEIWVRFPEYIERKQKREDFRLRLPYGTNIYLTASEAKWKLRVENLSRGGILAVETISAKSDVLFTEGDLVEELRIRFPRAREHKTIIVNKAIVKRVTRDTGKKRRFYAFQFIDLERPSESILIHHIYDLQREFLRRRLPIDA